MGPAYFVIAILGCADGGTACTPVATLPTRYSNAAECDAATVDALNENNAFDFPTLLARCRKDSAPAAASAAVSPSSAPTTDQPRVIPAEARRG